MNAEEQKHIEDYLPRDGRTRLLWRTKNFTLLVLAELTDGGWRPRWAYQVVAARKQFTDRWVGHDHLYATDKDALNHAISAALAHLSTSFSWTPAPMPELRREIQQFRTSFELYGVQTSKYAIWQ